MKRRRRGGRRGSLGCSLVGAVLLLAVTAAAQDSSILYVYDDLSRLVGVVDQQGNCHGRWGKSRNRRWGK